MHSATIGWGKKYKPAYLSCTFVSKLCTLFLKLVLETINSNEIHIYLSLSMTVHWRNIFIEQYMFPFVYSWQSPFDPYPTCKKNLLKLRLIELKNPHKKQSWVVYVSYSTLFWIDNFFFYENIISTYLLKHGSSRYRLDILF